MKTRLLSLSVFMAALCIDGYSQQMAFKNTIEISSTDNPEIIIEKAAHVIPSSNQMRALEKEFIAFIHFGPNTFTRMEWGNGMEDPKIFNLKTLDTDQWCEAIKSAGMKMVMLTVKHHDGFVLWQSRYTTHGIMSSGFQNGKGDILKELSESCKKYHLKLGIYLSPADLYQIENPKGLYGNLSPYTLRTIPRKVANRPFKNKTTFNFVVDDYNEYFLNQLFEVLTEYGPVDEVWFDGAHPKRKGGQKYNYSAWKKLIRTLAPNAVIFGKEDIRWCGNEGGKTRQTEWNVIPYPCNPDTASHFSDLTATDLGSREKLYTAKYLHYQQAETNTSIREGWFYRDDSLQKVRSADDVFDIYERSVGGNSTFLLNIPPNREGRLSPTDVAVLKETGNRIKATYGKDLLSNAIGPKQVLDHNPTTFVETNNIVISTPKPISFNRLVLQEAIASRGERVEEHAIDIWKNNNWVEIAHATNIGYKRILRFPEVKTSKIRLRVIKSRLTPAICNITAHYYESQPPQLKFYRDINGMVSITPRQEGFNWNSHGENISKNLNADLSIFYTTDGTTPNQSSIQYIAPFKFEKGEVKAIATVKNKKGTIHSESFGWIKKDWKVLATSSAPKEHQGNLAIDANTNSYWSSLPTDKAPSLSIDLGQIQQIKGFSYTPSTKSSDGMIEEGIIQVSNDGITWSDKETFKFGNLINDPTKRSHFFQSEITTRYIKISVKHLAGNGSIAAIAELDLF